MNQGPADEKTVVKNPRVNNVKKYNKIKLILGLANISIIVVFILFVLFTGLSLELRRALEKLINNPYLLVLAYVLLLGGAEKIITFPLSFYGGYVLEHKFRLSNQSLSRWFGEQGKSLLVGLVLSLPLLLLFYFFLRNTGHMWWFYTGTILFIFSVVLTGLAPVLIFPLFYRFSPLDNPELEGRLKGAAERAGLNVRGLYRFDMSRNTKKANAALAGLGKTRRILLGDTLLDNFTSEEIESVFSHELGHYHHRHIPKLLAAGSAFTFLGLYFISLGISWAAEFFRKANPYYGGLEDAALLPLIALFLIIYSMVTTPLQNALSRRFEYQSDAYAVNSGPGAEPFITAMNKLAAQNLADREPHPGVEFIFYSHPSIKKRIEAVKESLPHKGKTGADQSLTGQ